MRKSAYLILLALGSVRASMSILCAADASPSASVPPMTDNPLFSESSLPYHSPPFDKIKDEHYPPAFEKGMADQLKEVEAIAANKEQPTFENTIVALERSGDLLGRVDRIFSNLAGANTNPVLQKTEKEMSPKLAAHEDAIHLNGALFARVQSLYDNRENLGLDPESKYLIERYYKDFVRAGAKLSEADKTKMKAMNAELAELQTTFAQNVLKEKNADSIVVNDRAQLDGLSETEIAAASAAAKADKKEGKFVIALQNTTGQPVLTSLKNRPLREKIMKTSLVRNSDDGEFDNRKVVLRTAQLRAERAALLGYANHAAYQLEDQTAKNVETVNKLLAQLAPPAVANAQREAADMQKVIDQEKGGFQLASWDWAFYSEKVRQARYAFDESEIKPYFEINHVLLDGVFYAATKLYGITFKERHDIPVYQSDVRVFEVFDADGKHLALFYCDYFKRDNKNGGAWMSEFVGQSHLLGKQPVVYNVANLPKPAEGEPALISLTDAITMFHEFGHALHGMFSNAQYPTLAGTSTARDFVEFPSQFNEHWATYPSIFAHYAKHYKTGAPMPEALAARIQKAVTFNKGYDMTELLAAAELDMQWHFLSPTAPLQNPDDFEKQALDKTHLNVSYVPPRYRSTYFSHIWGSGYSAGYYAYLWTQMLADDAFQWFNEHGELTRANGDRFRKMILSRGNTEELGKMYEKWRGGPPTSKAMLKYRGLEQPNSAK